tara:strand:+ start:135 stop:392 length:258 start_codon:yes stop_codon:yes gene_type:complete
MKTQQQYFDEINNNWLKFDTFKDCYVKRRLRKLNVGNLKYILNMIDEQIKDVQLNSRPSEITSTKAGWMPIQKYINYTIDKKESA